MKKFFVILLLLVVGSVFQIDAFSVTATNQTKRDLNITIMYRSYENAVQTKDVVAAGTTKTIASVACGCILISEHILGGPSNISGSVCPKAIDDNANVSITITGDTNGIVMAVTPSGLLKVTNTPSIITLK
jgi:hypothetical protein